MIDRIVSHYKILEKIGEGGMGVVYLAEDMKLGRKVAMKILTKRLTEKDGARERFKREARTAAVLNHPNIVTVHEIDEYEDLIYIIMEYIEGETLDKKIKVKGEEEAGQTTPLKTLETGEIINIVLEICKGLEKAHEAGVVHRDIKLENILVSNDGGIKILDFGLAKLKGASKLTRDSVALGTAFYMSPEQLKGEELDQRIDIWSLGVMMYIMTTGEHPFVGDTTMEIMYAIMKSEPKPIVKLNKNVPPGLRRIINRCLKKNPDKRYQDVAALMADLLQVKESLVTGESEFRWKITSVVDTLRGNFFKIALPVAALALILTILFSIPSTSVRIRRFLGFNILPTQKRVALLPLEINENESLGRRAFTRGLVENLTRKLTRLEQFDKNLLVIPTRKLNKMGITSPKEARLSYGINLVIHGGVSWENDNIHLNLRLIDTKRESELYSQDTIKHISELTDSRDEVMNNIARMIKVEMKPGMTDILTAGSTSVPGAYDRYLRAWGHLQHHKEIDKINTAIDLFKRAIQIDSNYALAYAGLAEAYYRKYEGTRNEQWAEEAINYCNNTIEKDDRLACVYITLGKIYKDKKLFSAAERAFRKALDVDPVDVEAFYWTAWIYEARGNLKEAEDIYKKAIRSREKDFAVQNFLGVFYQNHNRYDEALNAYEKIVKDNPDYITGLNNLGSLYFYLHRRKEARLVFEKSLSLKPTYIAYSNLGTLYFHEGLFDTAVKMFDLALKMKDTDHRIWGHLAESYYWIPGKRNNAWSNYKRAAELAGRALEKKPDDPVLLSELAYYYERLGNRVSALNLLKTVRSLKNLSPGVMLSTANTYEQMGEREEALKWIKSALEQELPLAEIKNNPGLSGLRSDPRFLELLHDIKREEKELNKEKQK